MYIRGIMVRFPVAAKDLVQNMQTGSGVHLFCYPLGSVFFCLPGLKCLGHVLDCWHRLIPRLEIGGAVPPLPYVIRTNKMHTFLLIISFSYVVFDMFQTTKCSSSGRLILQFYGIFYMHPSKQPDWCQDVFDAVSNIPTSTRLLIWMNEKKYYKTSMCKSSWGWTLGCSKHVEQNTIELND